MASFIRIDRWGYDDHDVFTGFGCVRYLTRSEALFVAASCFFGKPAPVGWAAPMPHAPDRYGEPDGRIEVLRREDHSFTAIVGGRFADMLGNDEALGVVAAAVFGAEPPYLQTYDQWADRARRYRHRDWKEPAAMLAAP